MSVAPEMGAMRERVVSEMEARRLSGSCASESGL